MNLNFESWVSFSVGRLFTMLNGRGITQEEIADNLGNFPAVQSGEENNGVIGYIDLNYCRGMDYTFSEKPCLTVARSGSAGFVSFQKHGCVVGDSAKILLLPDKIASTEVYLFLQSVLSANRYKYTYGRKVTQEKYLSDPIDLPVQRNSDGTPFVDDSHEYSEDGFVPDWQFMVDYIKSLHHKTLTTKNTSHKPPKLEVDEWKEFRVGRLFDIELSRGDIKEDDVDEGVLRLISAGETNNGVVKHIDAEGDGSAEIFAGNKITVDMFCNAYYQAEPFYAVSHGRVNILTAKFVLNQYVALFITTIIKNEQLKYSYGRAVYSNVIADMIIKLPVKHNSDGSIFEDGTLNYSDEGFVPDWQFMENYIKSLPYGDRLNG